ncbi:TIGR04283 family arsenosugar biosynthesis glycosyltransferase [Croceitalea sp. MTPC9]|uniref:TIGR04283 family arsenosugar biosynthesis glycosyltransferase n=1 Tax=unclassified Croceitalea TaxID=2632280 RepID=UPI002B382C28|nr:TIGR04283 family arsenosugar biosynthesis glycosyltransferase [Croceitalea sp. MTPC6]GMN15339.1 TIGR04283 family arsenosugar biosynthesis glycosyltransferase [Croceitalea sp. MTPC9]
MISVIIPAHNEKKNLENLLPRLSKLAYGHKVEVLVCLSKDTKDGSKTINGFDALSYIRCDKKGRAVQMNGGAAAAKGDILVFLHADVVPPKGFFEDILQTINNNNDAGFFSYKFDKENFFLKLNSSFTSKDGIFTGGGDQCLFIRKSVFEKMGGFNEKQVLMEDFEFFSRMKAEKVPYKIIKNDLVVSSRKYEENSYLRVNLTNFLLVILFKFGYAPEKLKIIHNRLLRLPYQNNKEKF